MRSKSLFIKYSIGEKDSIANLCHVKAGISWQDLTKKEYLSNKKIEKLLFQLLDSL